MTVRVFMIDGQFGFVFSMGWRAYGRQLRELGYELSNHNPVYVLQEVVPALEALPAEQRVALLGYSLGGNAVSWIANAVSRQIDLAVAFDPTVRSYFNPLGPHVRRAISMQQTGYWGTSLGFGRGVLTRADDGPEIEVHKTVEDHLAVQSNPELQAIATQALGSIAS
jgi:thioesterase domain-containing protein